MPTNTSILAMDASDFDKAVIDSTKFIQDFNKEADGLISKLKGLGVGLSGTTLQFTKIAEGGQKMTATIGDVQGTIVRLGTAVKITNDQLLAGGKGIETATQNAQNFKDVTDALVESINKNASAQEAAARRIAAANKQGGQVVGTTLQGRFITPGPSTSDEVAKVSSAISKIQQLVASGNISVQDSLKIVNEVASGTQQTYTGVASKVAAAATQMIAAEKNLGAEFKKEREKIDAILLASDKANASSQAAVTERLREQAAQRIAIANKQGGQVVGTSLQQQFITPGPSTASEVARVSAAISKIQQLVATGNISAREALTVVNEVAAGTGQTYTGTASKVAIAASQMIAAQKGLGAEYKKIQDNIAATEAASEKSTSKLGKLWNRFQLVLGATAAYRAINLLRTAIEASVSEAANFEVRISEIRTISQANQLSFQGWTSAIRGLSDQFGQPISDVARGTYELISNQIVAGADATLFMQKAMTFANVAVTSTANSVDLLSSVLKGYNLNASEADIISAKLFTVIDLGRVRADDIANSLGKVVPLASILGIDFDNLGAALATITVQGVKPAEALTAIQGLMTKLERPTKETSALFKEWGVNSGQAAIATFGFSGVLNKFAEAAANGNTEISAIFNEIRGQRGFLGLTNIFGEFDKTLAQIKSNSVSNFLKAEVIATESAGKEFQIQANQIKNFFIEDFGVAVLDAISSITHLGGSVHNLTEFFGPLKTILLTSLEVFAAYKFVINPLSGILTSLAQSTTLVGNAQKALGLSVGGVTAIVGLGLIAFNAYQQSQAELTHAIESSQAEIAKQVAKDTHDQTIQINLRTQAVKDGIDEQFRAYFQHAADVNKLFNNISDNQKRAVKLSTEAMKDTFALLNKEIEKDISDLNSQITTALGNIKKASEQLFESKGDLTKGRFDRQVKLAPEDQQAKLLLDRADAANKSANDLLTLKTDDATVAEQNLTKATKERQDADRINNELLDRRINAEKKSAELEQQITEIQQRSDFNQSITDQADKIRDLRNELNDSKTPPRRRTALQKDLQSQLRESTDEEAAARENESGRRLAARLANLQQELALQKNILGTLPDRAGFEERFTKSANEQQAALKKYIELQNQIKDNAKQQLEEERKRFEVLKDAFQALAKIKVDPKLTDPVDKLKLLDEFDARQKQAEATGLVDPGVLHSLAQQRVEIEREADIQIQQNREALLVKSLEAEAAARKKQQADLADRQIKLNEQQAHGFDTIKNILDLSAKGEISQNFFGKFAGNSGQVKTDIKEINEALDRYQSEISKLPTILLTSNTQQTLDKIQRLINDIADRSTFSKLQEGKTPDQVIIKPGDATGRGQVTLQDLKDQASAALKEIAESEKKRRELLESQKILNQNLPPITDVKPLEKTTGDLNNFGQAYIKSIQDTTNNINALNIAFENTRKTLEKGFVPNLPAPQTKSHGGGIQWRSRGRDTVPAMLTPGEYVVNADATRRNILALMRMNSGEDLRYYNSGGLVTASPVTDTMSRVQQSNINTSFSMGDINVNLESTGNARVDGREIAQYIRNEIFAGRLSLPANRRKL
jgi:TP901 family phage tail tape measure protein